MTTVIDRPAPAPDVTPALEVGDTIEIVVTPDDIAQGRRDNCDWCPWALALRRAGYSSPSVGYSGVLLWPGGPVFKHSAESETWLRAFDNKLAVVPARFVLHRCQDCERRRLIAA